jgi:hypothetical protein
MQVLAQITAEAADPKSPKKVNTKDYQKALKDMTSALGSYFGFWQKFKGTKSYLSFFCFGGTWLTQKCFFPAIIGLEPAVSLVLDPVRVKGYIHWLEAYYGRGSTTRNKCWLVKGYVRFLQTEWPEATEAELCDLCKCKKILGCAANSNKLEAAKNLVLLADEDHMTAQGNYHYLFVCACIF